MSEDFLQFIWKYGLFDRTSIITDTGEEVEVITLGEHNADAGPDFLNARIKIGNTLWAGNVEVHLRSTDWFSHKHQHDRSYNNVILHVVGKYDQPVERNTGGIIPTITLRYNDQLYKNYHDLMDNTGGISCRNKLKNVDPLIIDVWINSMLIDRLQQKTQHIQSLLDGYKNNWEEVFYIMIAHAFGFGLNTLPFELMARSLPLNCLNRHRDNPVQVEALIMGQAGFLQEPVLFDPYYAMLRMEYMHLKKKYALKPVEKHLWKFLRLRPVNFPTIRLAQFAALLSKSEFLFSKVMACSDIEAMYHIFQVSASAFWDTHYSFETSGPLKRKLLGNEAISILVINAVIPFLFIYGKMTANENLKDRSLNWLNQIPPERNRLIRRWEQWGFKPTSAYYTQGIIQMMNTCCNQKKCINCSIGAQIITAVE